MRPGDLTPISSTTTEPRSTREWLTDTHSRLEHLLPARVPAALITEELTGPDGMPIDVLQHFKLHGRNLRTLLGNWRGLLHSVQAIGGRQAIDDAAPAWPGFEDVWIPVADDLQLAGRLGFANVPSDPRVARALPHPRVGQPRDADCIVLLPGLFGDNSILRTRDLAAALRWAGFHVLALELRAHGQTEARYPSVYYTFGVLEVGDLMVVSEWLQNLPHVRRTGLVGFCWGANLGLLAAWYDARGQQPHFSAGIMAFSPVLRFEELVEELETPRAYLINPVLASMQNTVRGRTMRKTHPEVTHSLRKLIEFEFTRSALKYPGGTDDGKRFLRLRPYRGKQAGNKLARARVPVLIVHAANDPLCHTQDVADLMAAVDNPAVAALILPGGGHVGFAPYARSYYFNLILSFFDPATGPAAALPAVSSFPAD